MSTMIRDCAQWNHRMSVHKLTSLGDLLLWEPLSTSHSVCNPTYQSMNINVPYGGHLPSVK